MRGLKRSLWLLAWGVWAWLGVGLYRELPRELRPRTSELPADRFAVLGFIGESDLVAIALRHSGSPGYEIASVDAWTGAEVTRNSPGYTEPVIATSDPPGPREPLIRTYRGTLRYSVLLARRRDQPRLGPPRGLHALDVVKNEWKELAKGKVVKADLHPSKPWVAIVEHDEQGWPSRAFIADYRTGQIVFDPPLPKGTWIHNRPLFLADRDAIVLPVGRRSDTGPRVLDNHLEVWRIAPQATLLESIDETTWWPESTTVAANGRALFRGKRVGRGANARWADVYDFDRKEFFCVDPPFNPATDDGIAAEILEWRTLAIAPTGRKVLKFGPKFTNVPGTNKFKTSLDNGALYEVDSGRPVWKAATFEHVTDANQGEGFFVQEDWQGIWKAWFPKLKFQTRAYRSLQSADLLYRASGTVRFDPRDVNASRTLVILADGSIHPWPLRVNWLLLLLCQTLLALPLASLWALLLWRRRRRRAGLVVETAT